MRAVDRKPPMASGLCRPRRSTKRPEVGDQMDVGNSGKRNPNGIGSKKGTQKHLLVKGKIGVFFLTHSQTIHERSFKKRPITHKKV